MPDPTAAPLPGEFIDREALAIFEAITDTFIILDSEWRIIYANLEPSRINRKPASEFVGRTHWEELPASAGSEAVVAAHGTDRSL